MPGPDRLSLRIGDRNVLNYTAKDAKTRAPIDMSGASAKAIQVIYTDENAPLTSTVSSKTITSTPDATKGEITDGAGGEFRFIYTKTDVTTLTEEERASYFFATKILDVNGDPATVEDGLCTFKPQLVANP